MSRILGAYPVLIVAHDTSNLDPDGREIRFTRQGHAQALTHDSWRGVPILTNHDLTSIPVGYVQDHGTLTRQGVLATVGFVDEDALAIYRSNRHKGWSVGIARKRTRPAGPDVDEIVDYTPHHLGFILSGRSPACPKDTCDTVTGYATTRAPAPVLSFTEFPFMPDETDPSPTPAPQAEASAEPQPEKAPTTTAPPSPAKPEPEAHACTCQDKADPPPLKGVVPEQDHFALRDELAELKTRHEDALAQLATANQRVGEYETAERETLVKVLPVEAGIDYGAESLETLRKLARVAPKPSATFSQAAPTQGAPEETAPEGSGAKEHNRPPAIDPAEAKLRAERERIAELWKRN